MTSPMKQTISIPTSWWNQWHDPDGLFEQVQRKLEPWDNARLFSDPAFQPVLDAWIAAKFAAIRNTVHCCRVRLIEPGDFPDFELMVNGRDQAFEATEADRLFRKRGDEYRRSQQQRLYGDSPPHDLGGHEELRESAAKAIEAAVSRKMAKKYGCRVNLIILVNVPTFAEDPIPIGELAELTQPACDEFLSTWLLWSNKVIRTWPMPIRIVSPFPRHA